MIVWKELYFTIGLEHEEVLSLSLGESVIYDLGHLLDMFPESLD